METVTISLVRRLDFLSVRSVYVYVLSSQCRAKAEHEDSQYVFREYSRVTISGDRTDIKFH